MKFPYFLILVLTIGVLKGNAQYHTSDNHIPTSTVYVFTEKLPIRYEPKLNAPIGGFVNFGDPLFIVTHEDIEDTITKAVTRWYKVTTGPLTGYVLASNITAKPIITSDNSKLFLQGTTQENNEILIIKWMKGDSVHQYHTSLTGYKFTPSLLDNQGLAEIKNIIILSYTPIATLTEEGKTYLIWNGETVSLLANTSKLSDVQLYYLDEKLLFPSDPEGSSGKLILTKEECILKDEQTNHWIQTTEHIEFDWNEWKDKLPLTY